MLIGTGSGGPAYMNAPGAPRNRTHPAFWCMAALATLHIVWPCLATERMLNNFIDYHSFYDKSLFEPEKVSPRDWLRPNKGRTDWHGIARKLDYAPRLGEIKVSALILCGRHDPVYAPACSEELAARSRTRGWSGSNVAVTTPTSRSPERSGTWSTAF